MENEGLAIGFGRKRQRGRLTMPFFTLRRQPFYWLFLAKTSLFRSYHNPFPSKLIRKTRIQITSKIRGNPFFRFFLVVTPASPSHNIPNLFFIDSPRALILGVQLNPQPLILLHLVNPSEPAFQSPLASFDSAFDVFVLAQHPLVVHPALCVIFADDVFLHQTVNFELQLFLGVALQQIELLFEEDQIRLLFGPGPEVSPADKSLVDPYFSAGSFLGWAGSVAKERFVV